MGFALTNQPLRPAVEQNLMLICSFRCDQDHNNQVYVLGHTLLCCLSPTYVFNKVASVTSLLKKSLILAPALDVVKLIAIITMTFCQTFLCCLSPT
jgi:hypothetical protein